MQIEAKRPQMEAMARERYGIEINAGPFGINSRPALIGAKYAEVQGIGDAYHDAVFAAYWQEAKNIEDRDVLADVAAQVGLSRDAFLDALSDETLAEQVTADIEQAFAYGLSGVPALVFNDKYLVTGAQPYELLEQVVTQVQAEV